MPRFNPLQLLVLVTFLGFLYMQEPKRSWEPTPSRLKECISNQNSIDKCVGVWESQNIAVPTEFDSWIDFRTDGRIARLSPELEARIALKGVPEAQRLVANSAVLFGYVKDENVFCCPERAHVVGRSELQRTPEVQFRWRISAKPIPELNGKTRGTVCLCFGNIGADGTTNSQHR